MNPMKKNILIFTAFCIIIVLINYALYLLTPKYKKENPTENPSYIILYDELNKVTKIIDTESCILCYVYEGKPLGCVDTTKSVISTILENRDK